MLLPYIKKTLHERKSEICIVILMFTDNTTSSLIYNETICKIGFLNSS